MAFPRLHFPFPPPPLTSDPRSRAFPALAWKGRWTLGVLLSRRAPLVPPGGGCVWGRVAPRAQQDLIWRWGQRFSCRGRRKETAWPGEGVGADGGGGARRSSEAASRVLAGRKERNPGRPPRSLGQPAGGSLGCLTPHQVVPPDSGRSLSRERTERKTAREREKSLVRGAPPGPCVGAPVFA